MSSLQAFSKKVPTKIAAHFGISLSIIFIQKVFFRQKLDIINEDNHIQDILTDYQIFLLLVLFIKILLPQILSVAKERKGYKDFIFSIAKTLFIETLMYGFLHLLLFLPSYEPQNIEGFNPHSLRTLSEKGLTDLPRSNSDYETISLSIGKIRNTLDIPVEGFVLSSDKNTAFLASESAFKIFDVRTFDAPVQISYLPLTGSPTHHETEARHRMFSGLFQSNDGKTLYYIHANLIEIIDISNYKMPVLITAFQFDSTECSNLRCNFLVAISNDENFLFLAREDMKICDISDKKNPKLIDYKIDKKKPSKWSISSLAVGSNGLLYLADGALKTFNISNIQNLKLVESYTIKDSISRILLSMDQKTAFLFSSKQDEYVHHNTLHEIDVSNSSSLKLIDSYPLDETSTDPPDFLSLSPDGSQIFIKIFQQNEDWTLIPKVMAFSLKKKTFWKSDRTLLPATTEAMIFQSSQRMFAVFVDKKINSVSMIELYPNFPNRGISSLANNLFAQFEHKSAWSKMALSSNNKLILGPVSSDIRIMEMWDVSNPSGPSLVRFFTTDRSSVGTPFFMGMSADSHHNKLFMFDTQNFYIYNLSDFSSKTSFPLLGSDSTPSFNGNEEFLPSVWQVTKDTNYLYTLEVGKKSQQLKLQVKNISDPSNIKTTAALSFPPFSEYRKTSFVFTNDQNTLFIRSLSKSKEISIFNVSDRSTVQLINSFPIKGEIDGTSFISNDDKTLFLQTRIKSGYQLEIYNITDLTAPQFLSIFPLSSPKVFAGEALSLCSKSKTIYYAQARRILVINISDLKAPTISGIISILDTESSPSIILSPNEDIAYLLYSYETRVAIVDLTMSFTLFFKREKFLLGEKYKETLMLLNFNESLQMYDSIQSGSYKFLKSFLLIIAENQNAANLDEKEPFSFSTTDSLPYWMDFDKENSALRIEPQRENAVGNYTLCSGISTQIPQDVFVQYRLFKNVSDSDDLLKTLTMQGFIDSRYFLTSRLTSLDEFIIPTKFAANKILIYNILKSFYFEPCTTFELLPNLNLTLFDFESNVKRISIQTPSTNSIKLDIKLGQNQTHAPGQFLFQSYKDLQSKILENSSRLILEGNLREIEFALQKLVINIQENKPSCDGKIIVTDYLNPQLTKEVDNICDYFILNQPPEENQTMTVQSQINTQTISTGQAFVFLLHEKTFTDRFPGQLTYELVYLNKGKRMAVPSWMSFNNLFLSGVPPEDFFKRDFDFILIAKNEFKQVEVPFSLHVNISSWFALKLVGRYSPYILTIIGLVIYFNKIYNILAKRRYKHPKEFYVQPSQEITSNVIYPVIFISEEKKESEKIIKALKELVVDELGVKSITLGQLASYFANQDSLDKARLMTKIKEAIDVISDEEENGPKSSSPAAAFIQQTINQIIINKITIIFLSNLPKGNITKKTFEDMKNCWVDIVDWDESTGLMINDRRFTQLLESYGVSQSENLTKTCHNSMNDEENLQVPLVENKDEPELNRDLLKDALLAHAFNDHHVDLFAENVQIYMKHKVKGNFITRFFKLNLKLIHYSQKYKAGYGLKHKIKNDILRFSGIIDEKFSNKTLVVQIASAKEKILKEIWIHGVKNGNPKGKEVDVKEGKNNKTYDVL